MNEKRIKRLVAWIHFYKFSESRLGSILVGVSYCLGLVLFILTAINGVRLGWIFSLLSLFLGVVLVTPIGAIIGVAGDDPKGVKKHIDHLEKECFRRRYGHLPYDPCI